MSKLKLDIDGLEDDFFAGSRMLGLMCQLKNYRFCWLLNARLRFDFRLSTDHEVQLKKKGRNYFFQVYGFYETGNELQHYVYQNQFEGEYLLPEFKHFDFRLSTDHEVQLKKKGRYYFFQVYEFYETGNELQHFIYQNQFEGEYLLPEFKHFDFLWLMQATIIPEDYFRNLQQSIKEINEIQLITELVQEKIKHKANLIL